MTENEEPLAEVLYRWWHDTLTVREADPDELEAARLKALERMEFEEIAHGLKLDELQAELQETRARAAELRRRLGSDEG